MQHKMLLPPHTQPPTLPCAWGPLSPRPAPRGFPERGDPCAAAAFLQEHPAQLSFTRWQRLLPCSGQAPGASPRGWRSAGARCGGGCGDAAPLTIRLHPGGAKAGIYFKLPIFRSIQQKQREI